MVKTSATTNSSQKARTRQKSPWFSAMIGGAVAIIVIILAIVLAIQGKREITDDFFVSDDTKLVLSLDKDLANFENSEYEPELTHVVYYNNGNRISKIELFYVYDTEDEAKTAYDNISLGNFAVHKSLNGRYVILTASDKETEQVELDQIKKIVETKNREPENQ